MRKNLLFLLINLSALAALAQYSIDWSTIDGGGNLTLSFPTVTESTYTLWRSDTLPAGSWTDTDLTALARTGVPLTFTVLPRHHPRTPLLPRPSQPATCPLAAIKI